MAQWGVAKEIDGITYMPCIESMAFGKLKKDQLVGEIYIVASPLSELENKARLEKIKQQYLNKPYSEWLAQ